MKGRKFAVMGLAVLIAGALWTVPVWADNDDPWAPDLDGNQLVHSGKTLKEVPIQSAVEDTGYPWFGEIQESEPTHRKLVSTFELNSVPPAVEDTGDPWFSDIQDNNQAALQHGTVAQ